MLIRYLNFMWLICDSRLHNLNLTRYSTILTRYSTNSTRYSTILTRYSTNSTRYSTILTWYSTNSTWYSTLLTRYSTILTRYSTNSTRHSTILTRYSTNLTQYSTISTRYSTILTRYSTILTWYSTNSTRYSTNLTWYSTILTWYLQLYKSWHSIKRPFISRKGSPWDPQFKTLRENPAYSHTYLRNSADPEKPTDLDLHCLQRQGISRGWIQRGFHWTHFDLKVHFHEKFWSDTVFSGIWSGSTLFASGLIAFPNV